MDITRLIKESRAANASDLHLIGGLPPALRVDGEIIVTGHDILTADELRQMVKSLLSAEQWTVFERERELCVSVSDPAHGRVRVTVYMHSGTPEMAIRLSTLEIPTAEDLGLPQIVDDLCRKTAGLILITGATGVGKTTTLNYMVDVINRENRCKIITIEDPVEYVHAPRRAIVVQQEVYSDTPSYSRALMHVLRQDPDVIVVGEMRDLETIETALTAAETGHLVVSTLHTPNVEQTIERIVGIFPSARQNQILIQLAGALHAVIGQLLLPRADRNGRVLAAEVMIANTGVRNIIREGNFHLLPTAMQTGHRDGMRVMDQVLLEYYQQGVITWDTCLTYARNPDMLQKRRG